MVVSEAPEWPLIPTHPTGRCYTEMQRENVKVITDAAGVALSKKKKRQCSVLLFRNLI